eukprot:gene11101-13581_t
MINDDNNNSNSVNLSTSTSSSSSSSTTTSNNNDTLSPRTGWKEITKPLDKNQKSFLDRSQNDSPTTTTTNNTNNNNMTKNDLDEGVETFYHTTPSTKVIREGYLNKQGHVRKNWLCRYFMLTDTALEYYKDRGSQLLNQIPLSECSISMAFDLDIRKSHCFKVSHHPTKRSFYLYSNEPPNTTEFEKDTYEWIGAIQEIIDSLNTNLSSQNQSNPSAVVTETHRSYEIVHCISNSLLFSLGKISAERMTDLRLEDFNASESFHFNKEGTSNSHHSSGTSPSNNHHGNGASPPPQFSYKFIDYAPKVFRKIRELSKVNSADYMISLTQSTLTEEPTQGRSNSLFYYTSDKKYLIKTITGTEFEQLRLILPNYYFHLQQNPDSLIVRFYGLHYISPSKMKNTYFVVMQNIFENMEMDEIYDLKGSTLHRKAQEGKKVLMDLDFCTRIFISEDLKQKFIQQIESDCLFLEKNSSMDYSLLLGIHYLKNKKITESDIDQNQSIFKREMGGLAARTSSGEIYDKIYFIGIIDILTFYSIKKQIEHTYKSVAYDTDTMSAVDPSTYTKRFKQFIHRITVNNHVSSLIGQYTTSNNPKSKFNNNNNQQPQHQQQRQRINKKSKTVTSLVSSFQSFQIDNELKDILERKGWKPNHVQSEVIPLIINKKRNVLVSSVTGSGKTLSYGIPMLQFAIDLKNNKTIEQQEVEQVEEKEKDEEKKDKSNLPMGLILVPSKDLAIQVRNDLNEFGRKFGIRILSIFGGVGEATQMESIEKGVDIIVGTPGRILELIKQEALVLENVKFTVIDEFDKLFNLGFFPDIKEIFTVLPRIRNKTDFGMQTALVSATILHDKHDSLITRFAPNHMMVNLNAKLEAPETIKQHFYHVNYRQKSSLLLYFLRRGEKSKTSLAGKKVLVFARTQQRVENLVKKLTEENIKSVGIHSDMSITQRQQSVKQFKFDTETNVIVATDVLARGFHYLDLGAVVNYDVPHVAEDYLHRIGRVGRCGEDGFSLTFISKEKLIFKVGERTVGLDENNLIKNIEQTMPGFKVNTTKIPGPWRGDPNPISDLTINIDEEDEGHGGVEAEEIDLINDRETNRNEKMEKRAVAGLLIKKRVLEKIKGPLSKEGIPRVRFNPNAKIKNRSLGKILIDRKGEIHELPKLTDFVEGRYESVVNDFDRKRAMKRGVGLKNPKKRSILPSKIMTYRQKQYLLNQSKEENNNNNSE